MNEAVHKYRQLPSWRRGTWRPRRLPKHALNEALGNAAYKTTGYKTIQVIRPAPYNLVILPLALPHGNIRGKVLNFSSLPSTSHTAESPTASKIRFRRMEAPKNEVQRKRWHLDFYLST